MALNASEVYRRQSVETSSERLVLMLYDGGVSTLSRAVLAIEGHNLGEANYQLLKAQDIIKQLMLGLDTSYEVGQNLELLYDYMINRLVEANVKKSIDIIMEVKGFLTELREVWEQILRRVPETPAQAAPPRTVSSFNVSG